ncbi:PspC domain-containing protein [Companilactobacillus jidongensis]|uniref:PspC domain-containing protein n=1 Tax=Companilactobacillus jidongensis TaxID=2486006 RepID=UPI000F7A6417|nr:PspC domain-containing protein [Companilactobacillus jidongensis]
MKNSFTRSSTNRMLAGVCGGLGEHFGVDSTWIRLGLVFITPFTYFLTIPAYIIAVYLMPEKRNIQRTDFDKSYNPYNRINNRIRKINNTKERSDKNK